MTIKLVAEIGSSPAPEWDFKHWCDVAKASGATDVKAQCFLASHFPVSEQASKRPLEFPRARLPEFVAAAHVRGLGCGVSVFDTEAVELAAQHCDWLKLAAREEENTELRDWTMAWALSQRKPVIRSVTNISASMLVTFGVTHLAALQQYPAPMWRTIFHLLKAAYHFRGHFDWGLSSHTTGLLDCILAARLGASVIEKHLAIDPNNIEAGYSLSPHQFKRLAAAVITR